MLTISGPRFVRMASIVFCMSRGVTTRIFDAFSLRITANVLMASQTSSIRVEETPVTGLPAFRAAG